MLGRGGWGRRASRATPTRTTTTTTTTTTITLGHQLHTHNHIFGLGTKNMAGNPPLLPQIPH